MLIPPRIIARGKIPAQEKSFLLRENGDAVYNSYLYTIWKRITASSSEFKGLVVFIHFYARFMGKKHVNSMYILFLVWISPREEEKKEWAALPNRLRIIGIMQYRRRSSREF